MQYRGPTSLASLAHGILRWAETEGIERSRLLRAARVDDADLAAEGARIPRDAHVALWRETERMLAEPAFGLRYVDAIVTPASLGLVGLLAMTSQNVGESVERSMRYGRLLKEDVFARAHRTEDLLVVEIGLPPSSPRAIADASLASIRRSMERWTGERIRVREVFFQHPRPAYVGDYDRVFPCPVRFGHGKNAIVFDREVAELQLTTAQPEVASYLDGLARAKLAELTREEGAFGAGVDLPSAVKRAVGDALDHGDVDLARVARRLGMSSRTLQRALSRHGLEYRRVVEEARLGQALPLVTQTSRSFEDIAERLGYAETKAFRRAFHRWTGMSPLAFRRASQAASAGAGAPSPGDETSTLG